MASSRRTIPDDAERGGCRRRSIGRGKHFGVERAACPYAYHTGQLLADGVTEETRI